MPNNLCEICQNPIDSGGDYYSPFCEPCQGDLYDLEMDRILDEQERQDFERADEYV